MPSEISFARQMIYDLKRLYGRPVAIYKRESVSVDPKTGKKTLNYQTYELNRGIRLNPNISRDFQYSGAFNGANTNFTYGAYFDPSVANFLIDRHDFPRGVILKEDDYIIYENRRFDVQHFIDMENKHGYIIVAKEILGGEARVVHKVSLQTDLVFEDSGYPFSHLFPDNEFIFTQSAIGVV